jgi:SAM-dependent methyltransferase
MSTQEHAVPDQDIAATRGVPSLVWRAGQDRRLAMMRSWAELQDARILVDGCGVGMYVRALSEFSPHVHGLDIEPERVAEAHKAVPGAHLLVALGERLPYGDGLLDIVFSHEVIEHVQDDRQMLAEALRVLRPGGRLLLFCPNRLYPFETHGCYWRGRYHFGNIPLINWLPSRWRNRLAPHVRAYTRLGLRELLDGLPARVLFHTGIYPGFDNIVARRPGLGRWLQRVTYAMEGTPLRAFGLSHFMVVEKASSG